ncbi:MAG: ribosome biogenesis GTPase Der [Planctomycetes bacterium]|nr:ribosome biogenesis GTPase Der [Planctomycetota bacterium]
MNATPMVAIVGRPNVGKSSLFNRILAQRISIEEPTEGVTRDRLIRAWRVCGRQAQLVDTGGIGVVDSQNLEEAVEEQIAFAIASSDLLLLVMDGMNVITDLDRIIAARVHRCGIPAIVVVNKVDNEVLESEVDRFRSLGFGELQIVSAMHGTGIKELGELVARRLPQTDGPRTVPQESFLRISLAGRRNVGKSSFVNSLAKERRVIVSDIPGTTRDAVDVDINWEGKTYTLVDTAGLRKKNQTEDSIEFFSLSRTYGAMLRSDIILFMLDTSKGGSQVDRKLSRWIIDHHKPCILVVNKWDLSGDTEREAYTTYLRKILPGLAYAPVCYISALKGTGYGNLFALLGEITRQLELKPTTNSINQTLQKAQDTRAVPKIHGTSPRLFYATSLGKKEPVYIVFGKGTKQIKDSYIRYLSGFFRTNLDQSYLPVRFLFRDKSGGEDRGKV